MKDLKALEATSDDENDVPEQHIVPVDITNLADEVFICFESAFQLGCVLKAENQRQTLELYKHCLKINESN